MKTDVSIFGAGKVTLVRDPEFPGLLEIRVQSGKATGVIRIWSDDDEPIEVKEVTLEASNDSD